MIILCAIKREEREDVSVRRGFVVEEYSPSRIVLRTKNGAPFRVEIVVCRHLMGARKGPWGHSIEEARTSFVSVLVTDRLANGKSTMERASALLFRPTGEFFVLLFGAPGSHWLTRYYASA